MAFERAPVGVLSSATAKFMQVGSPSSWRTSATLPDVTLPKIQARLSSASLAGRKRVAGAPVGHSSFRTGLSLGRRGQSNGSLWSAVWLDNSAQVEADVPISVAWDLWSDREGIPRWMPWIASVKVQEDQPELSKWTLKYAAFGQNFEFSWLSRNMKPTHHQKIHWRSIDGLPNRGTVRFYPRSPSSCAVQLTISYEVPQVLSPLASAVVPIVENILQTDLNRFAKLAKSQQIESQRK